MKKLSFALVGAVSLALASCGARDDDALENVEANADANELNALADNAAMEAENEALGNEAEEAAPADNAASTVGENVTDPSQVEDDVQGM